MGLVRKLVVVVGFLVIVYAVINIWLGFWASKSGAAIVPTYPTEMVMDVVATEVIETATVQPTATFMPSATPTKAPVQEYVMADVIDLDSGKSTALSIRLPEGGELPGTWAKAVAFKDSDLDLTSDPFDPHAGTIYSLLGDTTVVRAHSGQVHYQWKLFASNLDLYLRTNIDRSRLLLADGQRKLQGLVGTTAYLCQSDSSIEPFTAYDPTQQCSGKQLELRLVAATLIVHDDVIAFDNALFSLKSWLSGSYINSGFEHLSADNGFILITCVQKYPDQQDVPGVEDWEYNRVALGFEIVDLGE